METENFQGLKVDRSSLAVASPSDISDERAYWLSRTPGERLRHAELLRWINYGPAATARLQRVLEIAQCDWS
jgi:hypothetical protein